MASNYLKVVAFSTTVGVLSLQKAAAQDNSEELFKLNLENVSIQFLIETVATRTGKTFIVDPRVKATINIVSAEPLSSDRLYELFLSVLEVHGYAAVQVGSVTKIVPSSVGVQSSIPLLDEHSSSGDQLVSRVIQLNTISAVEIVETLRPLFPDYASITAESTGNNVVVTDRAANVDKLIELIVLMDNQ